MVMVAVVMAMAVGMLMLMVSMVVVVLMLATQVEVTVARVQDFHLNQVENEAHDCDNEHDIALDLGWFPEALGGLNQEPSCHDPDGAH